MSKEHAALAESHPCHGGTAVLERANCGCSLRKSILTKKQPYVLIFCDAFEASDACKPLKSLVSPGNLVLVERCHQTLPPSTSAVRNPTLGRAEEYFHYLLQVPTPELRSTTCIRFAQAAFIAWDSPSPFPMDLYLMFYLGLGTHSSLEKKAGCYLPRVGLGNGLGQIIRALQL